MRSALVFMASRAMAERGRPAAPSMRLQRASYHENVVDHYNNPRNVGSFDKNDPNVGTGLVGAPACGDAMKLQIRVDPKTGKIVDSCFKTFGCGSAIASSSVVVEPTVVASGEDLEQKVPLVLKQRTEEWQELRQDRLTASTFATALGFLGNYRRSELWAQKLGLQKPFPGNTATDWGIRREAEAIRQYEDFTGMRVSYLAFKVYKEGDKHKEWIGGSPDGLVEPDLPEASSGILEVKCPYNLGKPEFCIPWSEVPYHYMPQIQGLMEILERDWLDMFVWTMNGSALFRVERDPAYWELIFDVLNDFWWGSVVPGKKALAAQRNIDVNVFKPILRHKLTRFAIRESKRLSRKSILIKKFLV